jgi:hypothetical protein
MTTANPLKQFFRRPALYLKLPSGGKGYSEGVIDFPDNGELPVFPMTAIDEITSRTPDALYNGVAIVEIIKSCVPAIKDPWQVLSIDLDPILVAIRIATNGQAMEIDSPCPKCDETSKFDINLSALLAGFSSGDYDTTIKMNDLIIKFRPLKYKEVNKVGENQFEIQKQFMQIDAMEDPIEKTVKTNQIIQVLNQLTGEMLVDAIEYIKTPSDTVFEKDFIREYLNNCDKNTYNILRDKNVELRKSNEIKPLEVKCLHCEHEHEQSFNINITNFFE